MVQDQHLYCDHSSETPLNRQALSTRRMSLRQNARFLYDFQRDGPNAFIGWHRALGETFRGYLPGRSFLSTTEKTIIDFILASNADQFSKGNFAADLTPLWGKSTMQISDGADWERQRRACSGQFSSISTHRLANEVEREVLSSLEVFQQAKNSLEPMKLYYPLRDACFRALARIWFPSIEAAELQHIGNILRNATDIAASRMGNAFSAPLWMPTPSNLRYKVLAAHAHKLVGLILSREQTLNSASLLGNLARAARQPSPIMSEQEARSNVLLFLIAAYEFPTLGWLLQLLASHPQARDVVRAEVRLEAQEGVTSSDARSDMLINCIHETLRLFPAAPVIAREVAVDSECAGIRFQRQQAVVIPVIAAHLDPCKWDEPQLFRPERFISDKKREILTFGRGPRGCIAAKVAIEVMKTAVGTLLRHYDFEIMKSTTDRPRDLLKSYPRAGVPCFIR